MRLASCLLLLITSASLLAQNTPRTYFGTGQADIVNGDKDAAKKVALNLAFQDALEKAVGVYVTTSSITANAQSVKNEIKTQASGFIKKYDVVQEEVNGNVLSIVIKAQVYEEKIESAFSSRLSKFVEQNILGPCTVMASLGDFMSMVTFTCSINDPTLDMQSIEIQLPRSGWIRPQVMSQGTTNMAIITATSQTTRMMLQDIKALLEKSETICRLKDPESGNISEKKIRFKAFTFVSVDFEKQRVAQQSTDFANLAAADRKNLIQAIDEFQDPAENPVGPCFATINLSPALNWGTAAVNFVCMIRDPALDAKMVQLKLPNSEWADPMVAGVSPRQQAMLIGTGAKVKGMLIELRGLLDNPWMQGRIKDATSGKVTEKKLRVAGFLQYKVEDGTRKLESPPGKIVRFLDLTPADRKTLGDILDQAIREMK